jgi:uncharacterized protein (TIGR03086 family)
VQSLPECSHREPGRKSRPPVALLAYYLMQNQDSLTLLERALEQTGEVIARVHPDQAGLPTPCASFDVDALIHHVADDLWHFTTALGGESPRTEGSESAGWTNEYREAVVALMAAWRREGRLDGTLTLPFGEVPVGWALRQQISDLAVHAWDIAAATGQPTDLDPELGLMALVWARENLHAGFRGDESAGKAFGPEVPVPERAPIYERLAGIFGRKPRYETT